MAIDVVTTWSRRGKDWCGFWIGVDWWRLEIVVAWVWISGLCGSSGVVVWRLVGSLGYLMVVLLGLGVVCGFVSGFDGGSIEGFDGDFFKIGLLGYVGFWFGLNGLMGFL